MVRPAQYIEVTEPAKRYTADIPAPLSQIDEPTEDVFKEEKEAALKKEAASLVDHVPTIPQVTETKKCVVETQTDMSPKKAAKMAAPATSSPSSPQVWTDKLAASLVLL